MATGVKIAEGKRRPRSKFGWYRCPGCGSNKVQAQEMGEEKQLCAQCRSTRQSAEIARSADHASVAADQARQAAEFAATAGDVVAAHNASLAAQENAAIAKKIYDDLVAEVGDLTGEKADQEPDPA